MTFFDLGCFGKLPIYPDFIRHNAGGTEIHQLDQWFQEGLQLAKTKLGSNWAEDFSRSGAWGFVFSPKGSGRFLVGSFKPSRDEGGRRYPFFLFLQVERSRFSLPLYFAPLAFKGFLDRSVHEMLRDGSGPDIKAFLSGLQQISVPIPDTGALKEAYVKHLQARTVGEFWTDLSGDFSGPGKYLLDLNLSDVLEPLRLQFSRRFGLGLRFPLLVRGESDGFDIPFWFELMFRILGREEEASCFLWSWDSAARKAGLMVYFDPPSARQLLFLIRPDLDDDSWFDLLPAGRPDAGQGLERLPEDRKTLLDDEKLSLAEYLEKRGALGS